MHSFLIAAVTNYHKFSGLKQHIFMITVLEFRSPKIKVLARLHSFQKALGKNLDQASLLTADSNLHMVLSCAHICLRAQISPFYKDTVPIGLGPKPNGLILT